MTFDNETKFEAAFVHELTNKGWSPEIIKYPSEQDLIDNWAKILFENNRDIDRLNGTPLTNGEMQQILEQIAELKTPLKLNGFINGRTVSITRDNPDDTLHFGKEVSLDIYDRLEIAGGKSRYQIVQQPQFKNKSKILNDRRGDVMLLINGMPVIHVELKKSGIPVSQAYNQIQKYSESGLFTGLFSLIQVFVAMNPEETVYFANPGMDGKFNKDFYFHWADFNNEPINDWKNIVSSLLSIPMAHQLIGFYTVADTTDGILKVLRSYQYYAASAISDKVAKAKWEDKNILGGYIWHTTGSGKTMTSFKSAQLIANSKDADKVIFLMDRIELGTQSLQEYRGFADDNQDVQATENTGKLIERMKSTDPANTLIVTSIQKMSRIKDEEGTLNSHDIEIMSSKRVVFIIDEAHRSTFGDMLITIKDTFPRAMFFGFTGTPIQKENKKKLNTTTSVFGNELGRYTIADGIRDGNVLGFDPYKVSTYRDRDLRKEVALMKAKANTEQEALNDPKKKAVYLKFMHEVGMAGYFDKAGKYVRGIEDYLNKAQYQRNTHTKQVVGDVVSNWLTLSQNNQFHAIFATDSIPEAINYYQLFKKIGSHLKVTALFDPNIDNDGGGTFKQEGLVEILEDYNARYNQDFTLKNHAQFKKDVAKRLAHKTPYIRIEHEPDKQIDLLIVVDQMLTGFDSKWLNTLYLDKVLKYENIIQAFSRTNRLFGPEKPFGTIRYYRKTNTMQRNIDAAIKLYSGDKAIGLFVDQLKINLTKLNALFSEITELFENDGIAGFSKLPDDHSERGQFAKLFKQFNEHLEAAKIQGFKWDKVKYHFEENGQAVIVEMDFDQNTYLILVLRYKELKQVGESSGASDGGVPFEIEGHITEVDTGKIDSEFMDSRFEKFLKTLKQEFIDEEQLEQTLNELHKSFATLTQEEQKYANIFINEVRRGDANLEDGKSFRDYITEYQARAEYTKIKELSGRLGLDEDKLRKLLISKITKANINDFGRFDDLKASVDSEKASNYFEQELGEKLSRIALNIRIHNLLQNFIIDNEVSP